MPGYNIHAERVVDGNAGTLTALTLFEAGSTTTRTLGSTEVFHVTGFIIITEEAADVQLVADSAAAGRYLLDTKTAAGVPIIVHYNMPYICPKGKVPKFSGATANKSMCTLQGFIREA